MHIYTVCVVLEKYWKEAAQEENEEEGREGQGRCVGACMDKEGRGREGSAPYILTWWSLQTVRQTCTVNPACGVV